jgi:hypothetical protein
MAEAKGLIAFLDGLDVFEGPKLPFSGRLRGFLAAEPEALKEVMYEAAIGSEKKESLLKILRGQINTMDDRRQDYNGATSVEVWIIGDEEPA